MYKASKGNIYIEGRDYNDNEWQEPMNNKSFIGYCPQENILVNYLNVLEQLYLFGMVKFHP